MRKILLFLFPLFLSFPCASNADEVVEVKGTLDATVWRDNLFPKLSECEEMIKQGFGCQGAGDVKPAKPKVVSVEDIHFKLGTAVLDDSSKGVLSGLGQVLRENAESDFAMQISGHTDASGASAFNHDLSLKRAEAVREFLVREYGISKSKLLVNGSGYDDLMDEQNPKSSVNRRVTFARVN